MKRMANPRNLSHQFNVVHDRLNMGYHALTLHNFDGPQARVSFENYTDRNGFTGEHQPTIDIDYLKSYDEGKGYAKSLMQQMYQRYPKAFINWGMTIHPAATHLASQFEDTYPNRTHYEQNHDEYVEGTEGMYSGEPGY